MQSRKRLYNSVRSVPGLKPTAWLSVCRVPLPAAPGIQGQISERLVQHDDGSARSLSAAHPGSCRCGPLAPLARLRCPPGAPGLGKIVKELDRWSCSGDSAASEAGHFVTSEDALTPALRECGAGEERRSSWLRCRRRNVLAPSPAREQLPAVEGSLALAEELCEPALSYVQHTVMIRVLLFYISQDV